MREFKCITLDVPKTSVTEYCGAFQEVDGILYDNNSLEYNLDNSIGKHLYLVEDSKPLDSVWIILDGVLDEILEMERSSGYLGFRTKNGKFVYNTQVVQKIVATTDNGFILNESKYIHTISDNDRKWYIKNKPNTVKLKEFFKDGVYQFVLNHGSFIEFLLGNEYWEEEMMKCKDNPYYFAKKYVKGFNTNLSEENFNKKLQKLISD